jgi:hypothetical protein
VAASGLELGRAFNQSGRWSPRSLDGSWSPNRYQLASTIRIPRARMLRKAKSALGNNPVPRILWKSGTCPLQQRIRRLGRR